MVILQWQLRDLVYVCFKLPNAKNVLTHLRKCPVFEERNSPQVDTLILTWFSRDFVYYCEGAMSESEKCKKADCPGTLKKKNSNKFKPLKGYFGAFILKLN